MARCGKAHVDAYIDDTPTTLRAMAQTRRPCLSFLPFAVLLLRSPEVHLLAPVKVLE